MLTVRPRRTPVCTSLLLLLLLLLLRTVRPRCARVYGPLRARRLLLLLLLLTGRRRRAGRGRRGRREVRLHVGNGGAGPIDHRIRGGD